MSAVDDAAEVAALRADITPVDRVRAAGDHSIRHLATAPLGVRPARCPSDAPTAEETPENSAKENLCCPARLPRGVHALRQPKKEIL
jgi:hypothetical protein